MKNGPVFAIGQPIVCVKEEWDLPYEGPNPKRGCIYHVSHSIPDHESGEWAVALREFPPGGEELWAFYESHFAPVELLPDAALEELLVESLEGVLA